MGAVGDSVGAGTARASIPPKQARSAQTLERILDACEDLLRERSFDELTLLDICAAADVSSSSVYARFRGKDAILGAVQDRFRARVGDALVEAMAVAAEDDDLTVGRTAEVFTGVVVRFVVDNVHLAGSLPTHPATRQSSHDLYDGVVTVVVDLIPMVVGDLISGADLAREELRRKLEFIIRCTGAVAVQGLGNHWCFAERMGLDHGQFADELTALVVGYLAEHLGVPASELAGHPVDDATRALMRSGAPSARVAAPSATASARRGH